MKKISIVLAFSILLASVLLVPHAKADLDSIPYDNIGTEWSRNPNLMKGDDSWDSRIWHWNTGSLAICHSNYRNYVEWNYSGLVESSAQDGAGDPWKAVEFGQGYPRYENEIYDLKEWGWGNKVNSLVVEGSVTLYDNVGYTGDSLTVASDVASLYAYGWNNKASSLKLTKGSRVTLYQSEGFGGDCISYVHPTYQPPDLKVSDKSTITLEGIVSDSYTDTWTQPGWTGAKFDVLVAENRSSHNDRILMLELYFLRDGMNLAWNPCWLHSDGHVYNYLIALDCFPELVERTIYSGNLVKWKIDVKSFIENACNYWHELDIEKLSIVQVSFTLEAAYNFPLMFNPAVSCSLHRLRLAYTPASTVYLENAYNKPQSGSSWSKTPDSSSPSGYVMKASMLSANGGILFGPYITKGWDDENMVSKPYTVKFRLMVSSNLRADYVVYVDVGYNFSSVIQSKTIKADEFASPNAWQDFQLTFVAPASMAHGLEFRFRNLNSGIADISIDWIIVEKNWNASTAYVEGAFNKPKSGSSWSIASDSSSYSGLVMKASTSSVNGGCLFGPYVISGWNGERMLDKPYKASFRLRTTNSVPSSDVARIDVCYNTGTVIKSMIIKANDFTSSSWQDFQLTFVSPNSVTAGLEFRIVNFNNGVADIFADWIIVQEEYDSSTCYIEAAYNKQQSGGSWSRINDQTSYSGLVMKAQATSPNGGCLYGPYVTTDWSGQTMLGKPFTVTFRLKTSSILSSDDLVNVDICYNTGTVLQSVVIKANDFAAPSTWQDLNISFVAPISVAHGLEFRVKNLNNGLADVYVDYISADGQANASTVYVEAAYSKQMTGSSWSKVIDSSSFSGTVMKASASSSNGAWLFGPYISRDSQGESMLGKPYTVSLMLKISSNILQNNVAYIDVCCNASTAIQSRTIKANDFASPNTWQEFQLKFIAPNTMTAGLEYRIENFNNGIADLCVDYISVSPHWNASTAYVEGAYNKQRLGSSWSTVNDPSSWSGIVMKASASSPNTGCLYGPYISSDWDARSMLGKSFMATFRLKVSSNLTTDNVVRIDVCYNAGTALQPMIIKANDFTSSNTWQDFQVEFTTPSYLTYGLEFRVINLNNGITDLFADQISVQSIE